MVSTLLVTILLVGLFFIIDLLVGSLFSTIYLFIFFWFGYVYLSPAQATFYLIGLLFYALFSPKLNAKFESKKGVIAGKRFSGTKFHLITLVIGFVMFALMRFAQMSQPQTIILGTPTLSISGEAFSTLFAPAVAGLLGVIENRSWIVMFLFVGKVAKQIYSALASVFGMVGFAGVYQSASAFLIPLIPVVGVSALFGFFHSHFSTGSMIWAGGIMIMWIVSFVLTKDDTAMNTCHTLWNSVIQIGRGLQIVS